MRVDGRRGRFILDRAWAAAEIRATVDRLLTAFEDRLPATDARILIKPNLNNDLVALVGNSSDLRVLAALLEGLLNRGYRDLVVADGSNVGVHRRGIDTQARLRVDRLVERYGVTLMDLNDDAGVPVPLRAGGRPSVSQAVLEADFLITLPKVKTHAEAGLSCALKNQVGVCVGQDKREMHRDLGLNIVAINQAVQPDLVLVDGLVGMEGNGPGDGDPFRLGVLAMSDDPFLNDLAICRVVGMPWASVPYLVHAMRQGVLSEADEAEVASLPSLHRIRPAPPRSRLAELSEARSLHWLKLAARPLIDASPAVIQAAYRLGVVQDVYSAEDDGVAGVRRRSADCGDCQDCEDFCPTWLKRDEIGVKTDAEDCVACLYCWWVCPDGVLELDGPLGHLQRQVERYKSAVEAL